MTANWRSSTETMTLGEVVEYYVDGDEIVIVSNLAKNEIRVNHAQAVDLMAGLAYQMAELHKARDARTGGKTWADES